MTAALLRRGKADTEASILESSIKKLENDAGYAVEKDVLLPIYNSRLKNLKSNATKGSHVIQTTEQTAVGAGSVKPDAKPDRMDAASASKLDVRDKSDNAAGTTPTAKTDAKSKPDTAETIGVGAASEIQQKPKSDMHIKPSIAAAGALSADDSGKESKTDTDKVVGADTTPASKPKSTKPERESRIQGGEVVAQESDAAASLNTEPQSKLSTKGDAAQELPAATNTESKADALDVESKDASKMDAVLQTNPVEPDTEISNKTPDEAKGLAKPSKNIESAIDDDMDEEELEKIKNSIKEALAKLERAGSE